ncbi:MAG: acyl-CoA thioesterase [Burkholderiaceae bacterium]
MKNAPAHSPTSTAAAAAPMLDAYERVLSSTPFVVRRRVRWSDCDPAGVVFTGRFTDYVLSAVSLFMGTLAQGPYAAWTQAMGVLTPCRGLAMDFRGALWPDDEFSVGVAVVALRESSFDLQLLAAHDDRGPIFESRFSPICIPASGERRRVPIPAALRQALQAHLRSDQEQAPFSQRTSE